MSITTESVLQDVNDILSGKTTPKELSEQEIADAQREAYEYHLQMKEEGYV